jgi:superfamily II DNA/RNA helicase
MMARRASDSATRPFRNKQNQSLGLIAKPECNGSENGVFLSFSELSLSPLILKSVRERGYRQSTAIQSAAIPVALAGRILSPLLKPAVAKPPPICWGFCPQLRRVLQMAGKPRQTLMFSATMDLEVERVAREFMSEPVRVRVGEISAPPATIRQTVYPVTLDNKGPMLLHLLGRNEVTSAIVFTRTRGRTDRVTKLLLRNRFKAIAIHGGRSQNQRNEAPAGFRDGHYTVLVATDVAARGLDIPDVSHVINFDLPEASDSYIHRIGRTARMGKPGEALSLVMPEDGLSLKGIERTEGVRLQRTKITGFETCDLAANKQETSVRQPTERHLPARNQRFNTGLPSRKAVTSSGQR